MDSRALSLDWEVGVFTALRGLWRRLAPAPPPAYAVERVVHLEPHLKAFTVLAQVIAGAPVRVMAARGIGGVRGRDLLLPPWLDLAPDPDANRGLYLVRIGVSAAMVRLGASPGGGLDWEVALEELRWARRAAEVLGEELPAFEAAHAEALALMHLTRPPVEALRGRARLLEDARRRALAGDAPWADEALRRALAAATVAGPPSPGIPLWGGLFAPTDASEAPLVPEAEAQPPRPTTEAQARPVEAVRRVTLDPRDQEASVLQHTFEKVETADSYKGGGRDTDGADELDDHAEALEEVDLSEVIRGGDPAASVLRADVALDADVPDVADEIPGERGILYPEWDHKGRIYRPNWCTVYPTPMGVGEPAWGEAARVRLRPLISTLRRRLEIHRTQRRAVHRQQDGEDVDIPALVDELAALRAGHGGNPNLYIRKARQMRSFATTVLLDVSLSSDAWVGGRRVLDVARDAVLVLGEVAEQLGDPLQILAFASHTRHRCRVWEVKGWNDAWRVGRARLGSLKPQGYTRIGPALRHGAAELRRAPAERRLLLLVSDGKPTDYDRYEGRWGTSDVRQALREAEASGVSPHALAVDAIARDYLPVMFGVGAWDILPHPERLPEALATVYGKLTAG